MTKTKKLTVKQKREQHRINQMHWRKQNRARYNQIARKCYANHHWKMSH